MCFAAVAAAAVVADDDDGDDDDDDGDDDADDDDDDDDGCNGCWQPSLGRNRTTIGLNNINVFFFFWSTIFCLIVLPCARGIFHVVRVHGRFLGCHVNVQKPINQIRLVLLAR